MTTIDRLEIPGFDEVHRLRGAWGTGYVAIHAALSGRAFGGIRVRAYPRDEDALADALDLARAMSRKVVMAGVQAGGAKTVLREPLGDRGAALAALGDFIASLEGKYRAGPDYGFTAADDAVVRSRTRWISGGSALGEATAEGVLAAMYAATSPRTVAIQGLGAVGRALAERLRDRGVRVIASDVRAGPADGFEVVPPEEILAVPCDVLAPCAIGGVLDAAAIARLRCRFVCGAANNPLATPEEAERLHAHGVVYVPDFLANAGAVVLGASTDLGEAERAPERMRALGDRVREVLAHAAREGRSPYHVAVEMADARIAAARAG